MTNILWHLKSLIFYYTILHSACKSDNFDLIKYLISLNKIDIDEKTILILFCFIQFQNNNSINEIPILFVHGI